MEKTKLLDRKKPKMKSNFQSSISRQISGQLAAQADWAWDFVYVYIAHKARKFKFPKT